MGEIMGGGGKHTPEPSADGDRAIIFDVQRFSVHDGPGIRTLVFFKGCPLCCLWCQNPESLDPQPEIAFYPDTCIMCGECREACETGALALEDPARIDRDLCRRCASCAEVCPAGSLQQVGSPYTPEELLGEVLKDRAFYESSGGGVTLSGGEPLLRTAFLRRFLPLCRAQGVHTAMETCGHAPWEHLEALLPHLDLVLYDLKAIDPEVHRRITGRDNRLILANLERLKTLGRALQVRVPVVPIMTAAPDNLGAIAAYLERLRIEHVCLLPYHSMGEGKIARVGAERLRPLGLERMEEDEVRRLGERFFAPRDISFQVGG